MEIPAGRTGAWQDQEMDKKQEELIKALIVKKILEVDPPVQVPGAILIKKPGHTS